MIHFLKNLFSGKRFDDLVSNGAIIVDVRTRGEYAGGHVKGSLNIPLDQLGQSANKFKDKNQALIVCCASGMRSASAKMFLQKQGFTNVHNGGSWLSLRKYSKK